MGSFRINSASILAHWRPVALFIGTFLVTAVLVRYLWREWGIFAAVGVWAYVMCGRYVLPRGAPWLKAVAIGVFIGILFSTIVFFYTVTP